MQEHRHLTAAVDLKRGAGDIGRLLAAQVERRRGDIFRLSHAPQRQHGGNIAIALSTAVVLGSGRVVDQTDNNGVDAHRRPPLHRQRLGRRQQARLGGAVSHGAGRRAGAGDAGNIDDVADAVTALHRLIRLLGEH